MSDRRLPLVEVVGLRVTYAARDNVVLDRVDLELAAGESVLLIGPSGSGKSTLLHTLCGVVPGAYDADVEGRVRVGRHENVQLTPVVELAGTVGLLGQDPPSQVCLPLVEDELAFVLENRCVNPDLIGPRVREALDRVGLARLTHRRTGQLSGGELQRVGLAATLLGEPELLLLDEPTALLDPDAARDVAASIAQLTGSHGPATIMVEHRLEELAHLPDRVVVLGADGRLVADGSAVDVFSKHGAWLARTGAWLPLAVELSLGLDLPLGDLVDDPSTTQGPQQRDPDRRPSIPAPAEVLRLPAVDRALRALAGGRPPRRARRRPDTHPDDREEVLRARGASFASGNHVLVRGVELTLFGGEVTAVVGANGSGKTSLLLGLAGLLQCTDGRLDGTAGGMVFQHPEDQFVGRTVADDVAHGLRTAGVDEAEVRARVDAALSRFALTDVATADPFRLSGGQKRRLSVAAMAVLDQPVLLLDEPTFGQDRATAAATADTLLALALTGTAIAFATHDLRMVARIADQVVVVADGRIAAIGRPAEVFADLDMLAECALGLPALLDWWARDAGDVDLACLLDGLHEALPADEPTHVPEGGA